MTLSTNAERLIATAFATLKKFLESAGLKADPRNIVIFGFYEQNS